MRIILDREKIRYESNHDKKSNTIEIWAKLIEDCFSFQTLLKDPKVLENTKYRTIFENTGKEEKINQILPFFLFYNIKSDFLSVKL